MMAGIFPNKRESIEKCIWMTHFTFIDPDYKKKSDPMIFTYHLIISISFGFVTKQFTFSASVLLSIFSLSVLCFLSAPFGWKQHKKVWRILHNKTKNLKLKSKSRQPLKAQQKTKNSRAKQVNVWRTSHNTIK